jgi:hypothetical protein
MTRQFRKCFSRMLLISLGLGQGVEPPVREKLELPIGIGGIKFRLG